MLLADPLSEIAGGRQVFWRHQHLKGTEIHGVRAIQSICDICPSWTKRPFSNGKNTANLDHTTTNFLISLIFMTRHRRHLSKTKERPMCIKEDKHVASFRPSYDTGISDYAPCVVCKTEKHPLYSCNEFKGLTHDRMISLLKEHGICLNCLRPCHAPREANTSAESASVHTTRCSMWHRCPSTSRYPSHVSCSNGSSLLMTCRVI